MAMPPRRTRLFVALGAIPVVAGSALLASGSRSTDEPDPAALVREVRPTTTTEAPTTTTEAPTTTTSTTAAPPPPSLATPLTGGQGPVAASTPEGLAAQIAAAEATIHDPAATPQARLDAAHVQQVAYRGLVANPGWKDQVVAALPEHMRPWAEIEFHAGSRLRSMIKKPKTTLPQWRIVAPAPADELLGYYKAAEAEFGVPWQYLASINLVETRMGRIRGVSSAGAQGPMQFMPATWAAYGGGGDVHSNADAIRGAARYLHANGAPGDMRNALWNYNRHTAYVDAIIAHAERMMADPQAYYAYHGWQVYYFTANGDVWLYEGWENTGG